MELVWWAILVVAVLALCLALDARDAKRRDSRERNREPITWRPRR